MSDSEKAEIISKKIEEFVQDNTDEFLKLIASIDKASRHILKGFFDKDEHSGLQMFNEATEKMENGERNWDYDKVKIEAMIYNTANSLLTNKLKKKLNNKITFISFDKLLGEETKDGEDGKDIKTERTEPTYNMQEISDDTIIEMVKAELPKIENDVDLVSIMVMEEILNSNTRTHKEIADNLKIDDKEVKNSFERIRRARNKVWSKLSNIDKEYLDSLKIEYRFKDILKKSNKEKEEETEKE